MKSEILCHLLLLHVEWVDHLSTHTHRYPLRYFWRSFIFLDLNLPLVTLIQLLYGNRRISCIIQEPEMARIRQGDWRQTFTFEVGLRSFILVYILPRDINTDLLHYFIGGFELFKFFCLLFVFYLTAQHKGYVIRQNI